MDRIPKSYLHRSALVLLLIACCWVKIQNERIFNDLYVDKSFQLLSASSLQQYGVPVYARADAGTLTEDELVPIKNWPPAYALIMQIPHLIHSDWIEASILLDQVAVVMLILLIVGIAYGMGIEFIGLLILLIFLALSFAPFSYLTSTDLLSLDFILLALFILQRNPEGKSRSAFALIAIGVSLGLAASLRYMYPPVILASLGMLFLLQGLFKGAWKFRDYSLVGVPALLIILAQQLYLMSFEDSGSIVREQTGFFLSNLLQTDNFLFRALFFSQDLINSWSKNFEFLSQLHMLFGLLVALLLLFLWIKRFLSGSHLALGFLGLVSSISILIFAEMALLSLYYAPKHGSWTYIEETRYFSVSMVFGILLLFTAAFKEKGLVRILSRSIIALAILFSSAYFVNLQSALLKGDFRYTYIDSKRSFDTLSIWIDQNFEASDRLVLRTSETNIAQYGLIPKMDAFGTFWKPEELDLSAKASSQSVELLYWVDPSMLDLFLTEEHRLLARKVLVTEDRELWHLTWPSPSDTTN